MSFTTRDGIAKITTRAIFDIKAKSAKSGGIITDDGGAQILEKGVVVGTSQGPNINGYKTSNGSGSDDFISSVTKLLTDKNYYLRSYVTTIAGTSYGNEINFKTEDGKFNSDLSYGSVSDIEGNSYKTIKIGNQIWMAENLRTSKYNTGTLIPVLTISDWRSGTDGLFNYGKNEDFLNYGRLYNGYAANKENLCPLGWHVPSKEEFDELINFIGGDILSSSYSNLLLSVGGWENDVNEITNLSGLSLLPSGTYENGFEFIKNRNYTWVTNNQFTTASGEYYYFSSITYFLGGAGFGEKYRGACVRCLKD